MTRFGKSNLFAQVSILFGAFVGVLVCVAFYEMVISGVADLLAAPFVEVPQ